MGFGAAQILTGATKLSDLGIDLSKNWLAYLIKNLGDPVDDQDAVTKAWVLTQSPFSGLLSALTVDISKDWQGYLIKNLGDPVDAQDAATRAFAIAQGGVPDLTFDEPTRAFDTIYQNTSGGDLFVSINVKLEIGPVGEGTWIGGISSVGAEMGATTPNIYVHELTLQCYLENVSNDAYIYDFKSMFFIVPKNWYYRAYTYISSGGVTPTLFDWIEWSYS